MNKQQKVTGLLIATVAIIVIWESPLFFDPNSVNQDVFRLALEEFRVIAVACAFGLGFGYAFWKVLKVNRRTSALLIIGFLALPTILWGSLYFWFVATLLRYAAEELRVFTLGLSIGVLVSFPIWNVLGKKRHR